MPDGVLARDCDASVGGLGGWWQGTKNGEIVASVVTAVTHAKSLGDDAVTRARHCSIMRRVRVHRSVRPRAAARIPAMRQVSLQPLQAGAHIFTTIRMSGRVDSNDIDRIESIAWAPEHFGVRTGVLVVAVGVLAIFGSLFSLSLCTAQSVTPMPAASSAVSEPITPIPDPPAEDPLKVSLGKQLFNDPRLSRGNSHSCASCHDVQTNGAGKQSFDLGLDGSALEFNTPTVFNAALNFRFGWRGEFRTLQADTAASLASPHIMGITMGDAAGKLRADPGIRRAFIEAYATGPDADNILDAITSYERTLVTPNSKFDRWLKGDATALSVQELKGYHLFKSLGCVSCHQGVNVGGNLFEQRGVFTAPPSSPPDVFRVPSLRNVATTPPYFHNGSAPTLDEAVRRMARTQLNTMLPDEDIAAVVAYLNTLTGEYQGASVRAVP
jgi:cytochrome c peroxidase